MRVDQRGGSHCRQVGVRDKVRLVHAVFVDHLSAGIPDEREQRHFDFMLLVRRVGGGAQFCSRQFESQRAARIRGVLLEMEGRDVEIE